MRIQEAQKHTDPEHCCRVGSRAGILYLFQILLPPDAGGAAAPLGGSHDLQRRHLAAQVHEEEHGKRGRDHMIYGC